MSWKWIFKMAWRDSRSSRSKLFLYMAAIIVGVAAQVSISSFRDNLNTSIAEQSKELLGADLEVEKNAPFDEELEEYLDSMFTDQSHMIEFASMVYFPKNENTRLSQISASDGIFPYYGNLETNPLSAVQSFKDQKGALVEQAIMQQFGLEVGDSVKVGLLTYEIVGELIEVPGQVAASAFLGPRVLLPIKNIENSGLLERGSRVQYKRYIKYPQEADPAVIEAELDTLNNQLEFRYDDVAERQQEVGEAISQLSNFLNLIGFIALLLGGIGIASSIFVYIRQKIKTVAVLRCVGASSAQSMFIYLVQATAMGFIGATIGAVFGLIIQLYFPVLVADFIPVDIELFISWPSVLTGIFTGVIISMIFALYPLLAIRTISPLFTIRSLDINLSKQLGIVIRSLIFTLIGVSVIGYAWLMLSDLKAAILFTIGLIVILVIITGFAKLVMVAARRFLPVSWSYIWRQGLSNLYRPNNQTTTLLLTFGLGVTLISSLYLSQDLLLSRLDFDEDNALPNLAFFDVQYDQNDGVNEIIRDNGLEIIQNVPIVTMRLQSINSYSVDEILADTNRQARRWALTREYRSTYRDSLTSTETLTEGKFIGAVEDISKAVPITLSTDLTEDLNVSVGDTLIWNVQGIPITSYISGLRTVNWETPQPNFFAVFPRGVLEPAPQFFATTVRTSDKEQSLDVQRAIVQKYPNVSAIDVGQIINTVQEFIGKITFVIRFIGMFSIITGLIVLAGSAATSRFQRIREAVLLRTLGALKVQVIKIQIIEYVLLGILAAFTGLALSVGTTWLLAIFYFEIDFIPNWRVIGIEVLALVTLVLAIGLLNTRGIHNKPPLEVLRSEAE